MKSGKDNSVNRLKEGNTYFWYKCGPGKDGDFQEVVFLKHKPHPGEVWVSCKGKRKSVHRRFLFLVNGSDRD